MTDEQHDERIAALDSRLAEVRERVRRACAAAGRPERDVTLLLASKAQPLPVVRAAVEAAARTPGPVLLGENRVQELVAKAPALLDLGPAWHFIGPLQSNKINAALPWVSCVESLASLELAHRLAARVPDRSAPLDVMVQVNVSGEPTKSGVAPDDALALARDVAAIDGLRLVGLMTVGARSDDEAVVASGYDRLRSLRDEVLASGAPGTASAVGLSMGMSGDLELAIAHGATVVRIGSAVFGGR